MSEKIAQLERRFTESALAINYSTGDAIKHLATLDDNDLLGHLEIYKTIYEANERLEKGMKLLGEIKRKLSYEVIPELMKSAKVPSIRFEDRLYSLGTRIDASIPQAMQEKGYQWLRDNGLGDAIKATVNAKTLSSIISDFIEETAISPPEDCVKIHTQDYISMRR